MTANAKRTVDQRRPTKTTLQSRAHLISSREKWLQL